MNKSIRFIIHVFGLLCTIIVFATNDNSTYPLYYLVPLLFTIYTILEKSIWKKIQNNIGYAVFFTSAFIRYLIMPLLFCYSEDINMTGGVLATREELREAVLLQLYEEFCVLLLLLLLTNDRKNKYISSGVQQIHLSGKKGLYYLSIILVPIIFFFMRDMIAGMNFVWNLSNIDITETVRVTLPLAGFFTLLFNFGRILFILLFIDYLLRNNSNSKIALAVCMFFILLYVSFISNLSRMGIVLPLIVFGYLLVSCFPKQKKNVFAWGAVLLLVAIIGMTYIKSFSEVRNYNNNEVSDVNYWASSLQAYFMGLNNIAIGLRADSMVDNFFGNNRLLFFINDNITNIAGLSHFSSPMQSSVYIFNYIIHTHDGMDQICPNIINGYLYFGRVFSPLYSLFFILLMVFFDNKAKNETELVEKFCWLFAAASCGLIMMVGGPMIVSFFVNNSLFLFLFAKLNKLLL